MAVAKDMPMFNLMDILTEAIAEVLLYPHQRSSAVPRSFQRRLSKHPQISAEFLCSKALKTKIYLKEVATVVTYQYKRQ